MKDMNQTTANTEQEDLLLDEAVNTIDEDSDFTDNDDSEDLSFTDATENPYDQALPDLSEEELDAIADTALAVIRGILFAFNAEDAEIDEYEGDEEELIFDIIGDNLAVLIGRHGRNLEALQTLVSATVSKRIGYHYPIVVDVEGYVNRRKQKLVALAKSSAARAIRQKRDVRLKPMTPYERRIIHMALKNDTRISTESEGIEPNRQIVIHIL